MTSQSLQAPLNFQWWTRNFKELLPFRLVPNSEIDGKDGTVMLAEIFAL